MIKGKKDNRKKNKLSLLFVFCLTLCLLGSCADKQTSVATNIASFQKPVLPAKKWESHSDETSEEAILKEYFEPSKSRLFAADGVTCWMTKDRSIWCIGAFWGKAEKLSSKMKLPMLYSGKSGFTEQFCFANGSNEQLECWPNGRYVLPKNIAESKRWGILNADKSKRWRLYSASIGRRGILENVLWSISKENKLSIWPRQRHDYNRSVAFDRPVKLIGLHFSDSVDAYILGQDIYGKVIFVPTGHGREDLGPIEIEEFSKKHQIKSSTYEICGLDDKGILTCKSAISIIDSLLMRDVKEPTQSLSAYTNSPLMNHPRYDSIKIKDVKAFTCKLSPYCCYISTDGKFSCNTRIPDKKNTVESEYKFDDILEAVNRRLSYVYTLDKQKNVYVANLSKDKREFLKISPNIQHIKKTAWGNKFFCLLTDEGEVFCQKEQTWEKKSNLKDIVDISASSSHICAMSGDERVFCWGDDSRHQLGTGIKDFETEQTSRGLPLFVRQNDQWVHLFELGREQRSIQIPDFEDIFVSKNGFIWALGKDGFLRYKTEPECELNKWKKKECYLEFLYNNFMSWTYSPKFQKPFKWKKIKSVKHVVDFAGDAWGVDMLTTNGAVWRWELVNPYKFIGKTKKLKVKNVKSIPAFGCYIDKQDTLFCEIKDHQFEPIPNVSKTSISYGVGCAVKKDGTVWCWGNFRNNRSDHLIEDTTAYEKQAYEPQQVKGVDDVIDIDVVVPDPFNCSNYACALKKDGTVWCWSKESRQYDCKYPLGQRDDIDFLIPAPVRGLNNVEKLYTFDSFACAVANKKLQCWGNNFQGPRFIDEPVEIEYGH